ncbi:MAG TPA: DUF4388 domain-containing protein [Ktedonobacteraceae bacterium]|nr:DUF4388 domain-containing protein [Ktedonobacteraceae bacterium]
MSLIGSLEQFDLANILRRIEVFTKTGLLVAKQGTMWVEFYFRQGQLVCVGPMRANVTLIDRLLQANLLAPQSLPQVKRIVEPSEVNETRIALTLINEGLLSREILRAWSSHETSQILQAIFSWPEGEIYFEDDCPTPADRLLIALSVSALLEALPPAVLAPRAASVNAPSTDELSHAPQSDITSMPTPFPPVEIGSGGQVHSGPSFSSPAPGLLNASQLIEHSPAFKQPETPRNGEGIFNASQLIEDFPFNTASAGGPVNAAQLLDDVPPPSFASANPAAIFGAEIDIAAPNQISILPPQPVRNPLPPARIDTSFMTPELVLAPVDLSTLRERNPQVQLTPDQWSLFALVDGQLPLQALCQALNAPAEQVCMVAGELMAIGLVMPLNPSTGALSELMSPAMGMSPSAQYPVYTPQPMMSAPNEMQSQRGNSTNGAPFSMGGGWRQGQSSPAYAPVGGYR